MGPGAALLTTLNNVADVNERCELLTEFAEIETLFADWRRLQGEGGNREIFQHPGWIVAWWQCLREGGRPYTPVVLRHDRVVAILPLILKARRLRFIGHSVSDYNHFLAEPADGAKSLALCLDVLLKGGQDWDEILFDNVPDQSLLHDCLRNLPSKWRRWTVGVPAGSCPTLLLGAEKEQILKAMLARESLKRPVRRLKRVGELSFRHIETRDEALHHLGEFARQHIRRSAISGRRSSFLADDYLRFYRNLLDRLDLRSEIRFSVLALDGRPISYHFGMQYGPKYLWYKPAFDVNLWELSPGQVHLWYILDHLRTAEVREFDFGLGDESFKFRFNNAVAQNLNFSILRPRYRSFLPRLLGSVIAALKDRLRSSALGRRLVDQLRTRWQDMRLACRTEGITGVLAGLWRSAIFDREVRWLAGVDASAQSRMSRSRVAISKAGLGDLADLAQSFPDALSEARLTEARKLLREERTAWVAEIDASPRAVCWTSSDTKLEILDNSVVLPERSLIMLDLWRLVSTSDDDELVSILQSTAQIAGDSGLPLLAVCGRQTPGLARAMRRSGFRPSQRFVRTRLFGTLLRDKK